MSPLAACLAAGMPGKALAAILNHLRAIGADKDDYVTAFRKTAAYMAKW